MARSYTPRPRPEGIRRFAPGAVPWQCRALQSAVRDLPREMDHDLLPRIATLQPPVESYLDSFWKVLDMMLLLGGAAIGLAIIGIYGVVAFSVSRRTREMGIRMALGTTRRDIVVSVIASGVRPILWGVQTTRTHGRPKRRRQPASGAQLIWAWNLA